MSGPDSATLDGLLRYNALQTPEAISLVDTAGPSGELRRLSYLQLDRAVTRLAARLQHLGVPAGAVVALQAANTAESVVALLGIMRAGLTAAPLPLLWRQVEASAALREVEARILIAASEASPEYIEAARSIALEAFSIRYVCTFGASVPDGMTPLGNLFDEAEGGPPSSVHRDATRQALVTFDMNVDGPTPRARTHAGMIFGGLATVGAATLRRRAAIVGTMLPSSFAVLATTIVPWLLTGGVLALHAPFDPAHLAALLADVKADLVVVPGPLVAPLAQARTLGVAHGPAVLGLWRSPERQPASGRWTGATSLLDVLAFGEIGVVVMRRGDDGMPTVLRAGPCHAEADNMMSVLSLSRGAQGTLQLSGAMTPGGSGPIDTGFPCRMDAATGMLALTGPPAGTISIGGYRFALAELQNVVDRVAPGGVLTALPDLLAGQKLAGAAADNGAVRDALAERGVSPLVGAAFRDRRTA